MLLLCLYMVHGRSAMQRWLEVSSRELQSLSAVHTTSTSGRPEVDNLIRAAHAAQQLLTHVSAGSCLPSKHAWPQCAANSLQKPTSDGWQWECCDRTHMLHVATTRKPALRLEDAMCAAVRMCQA